MRAQVITEEQVRQMNREYNPMEWDKEIDRMSDYDDVVYYVVKSDDVCSYDRYWVEYTLSEGLRLFRQLSYSSCMTNGGFYRVDKLPITSDGKTYADVLKVDEEDRLDLINKLERSNLFDITFGKMMMDGNPVMIGTSKEARSWMTNRSKQYGMVFTKG